MQTQPTAGVKVAWLGTAGLAIMSGGRCVLVDPYFSRLPLWRLSFGTLLPVEERVEAAWRMLAGEVCAVLAGHSHSDHVLDIPLLAERTGAPIFGNASLDALLTRAGQPNRVTVCRPGDTHAVGTIGAFTVFGGAHGDVFMGRTLLAGEIPRTGSYPLRAREYRAGEVLIFDITVGGRRIVHIGSAGISGAPMPKGACDVLFLCAPGWRTHADYPAAYLKDLQPRYIMPFHFDWFGCPLDDPRVLQKRPPISWINDLDSFLKHLRKLAPKTPVVLPQICEPMALD